MGKRKFSELLKDKKDLVGAEIGVFRGEHAKQLLENLDIKKLYLVDLYKCYPQYEASAEILGGLGKARKEAKKELEEHMSKIAWLIERSETAVKKFSDGGLDFVYIDGNHAYRFVKQDVGLWSKKVKKGGLVGGHDYDERHGVIPAVTDFAVKNKVDIQTAGIEWWYWK